MHLKTVILAASALFLASSRSGVAADESNQALQRACDSASLLSVVDRSVAGTSPCIISAHHYIVESGYYQNASTEGGSQLAAYPLVHLRYAVTPTLEVFVDPATAIAKNGLNGQGIYTWTRSGAGIKFRFLDKKRTAAALRLDYTPQADETAAISTRDRFDTSVNARTQLSSRYALSGVLGNISYTEFPALASDHTSAWYERVAVSDRIARRTQLIGILASQSGLGKSSTAQSKYGIAVQQTIAQHSLLDVEIGSAFNAVSNTKAHYLGAGFTLNPSWQR